jgi:hypothetical protein
MTSTTSEVVARLTRIAEMARTAIDTGGREDFDPRGVEDDVEEAISSLTTLVEANAELTKALEWYADRVGGVRAWTVEGARVRADLSEDNGRIAYEALSAVEARSLLSTGGGNG